MIRPRVFALLVLCLLAYSVQAIDFDKNWLSADCNNDPHGRAAKIRDWLKKNGFKVPEKYLKVLDKLDKCAVTATNPIEINTPTVATEKTLTGDGTTYRVVQFSNDGLTDSLYLVDTPIIVTSHSEAKATLGGTCNGCSISSHGCACTKMMCIAEKFSEQNVCRFFETDKNLVKLAQNTKSTFIAWRFEYIRSDSKRNPWKLNVEWMRLDKWTN